MSKGYARRIKKIDTISLNSMRFSFCCDLWIYLIKIIDLCIIIIIIIMIITFVYNYYNYYTVITITQNL